MRILVTRPQPEAAALCARLRDIGHDAIVDPLLTVEFLEYHVHDSAGIQAVLVTSRNALRSLERNPRTLATLIDKPILAVGPATSELARGLGFARVIEGPGTAAELAGLADGHLRPDAGALLYLAAEVTAYDLASALRARGFTVDQAVVYRTIPARTLEGATLASLNARSVDAVLLLSARTAQNYSRLVTMHNQLDNIRKVQHLCLSEAVAQQLRPLGPLIVRKAAYPNIEELVALAASESKSLP